MNTELRRFDRFGSHLRVRIIADSLAPIDGEAHKAVLVSFSKGGCAIRTSEHLSPGLECEIQIAEPGLARMTETAPTAKAVKGQIVWGRNDFRIDTLYCYGIKWQNDLDEASIASIQELEKTPLSLMPS